MWPRNEVAKGRYNGGPSTSCFDQVLRSQVLFHPVETCVIDVVGSSYDEHLGSQGMCFHQSFNLRISNLFETSHCRKSRPCSCVDVLILHDQRLAGPVHGVLPAGKTAEVVPCPCTQRSVTTNDRGTTSTPVFNA